MDTRLTDISIGQKVLIKSIDDNEIMNRLAEFGAIPGTEALLLSIAPLGGPLMILIHDSRVAVRREEAKHVFVE